MVQQMVQGSVDKMKAELVAYIDKKFEIAALTSDSSGASNTEETEDSDPITLSMIMLQIAAIFEKFGHYDEIYRTYGIEADAFQDECNEVLDLMRYQVEQVESQLKDFQNRLHIEESGGESAVRHNAEMQEKFEILSKDVQESISQFDQYIDTQLKQFEDMPQLLERLQQELASKQGKSESLVRLQEHKSEMIAKIKAAVEELNLQLPKVVSAQIEKALKD
ncbi:hypothetical protein BTA35_0215520 [Oceanospirillum linum]|uniref:Uncharacterized protein n=2 Tax=Oceanospirillum linum TaxID=966 RepID=A0A1T1H7V3_OCELI|nr:hypothetical protein BTA35_0215520 [Oceanospirillum linum]SEG45878.1 hypothetical protein SAMN04489856_111114 [Oleiphilus messinensis]SMP34781.1 hypothetical protein SAMN06264348_111113 [Oceanospirillum linum]